MKVFENMKKKLSIMLALAMVFGLVQGVSIDLSKVFADTYNSEKEISGCAIIDMGEISLNESKEIEIKAGEMLAFTFTAPEDGTYYFFTEGVTDTYGVVAEDSELVNIVAANDDGAIGTNCKVTQYMEKDQTYVVAVRAFYTERDTYSTLKVMTEEAFNEYVESTVKYQISGQAIEVVPNEKTVIEPLVFASDYYGNPKGHYEDEDGEFIYDPVDTTDFEFTWYEANDFDENGGYAKVLATTKSIEVTLPSNSCTKYAVVMRYSETEISVNYISAYTNDFRQMCKENYVDYYFMADEKAVVEPVIYLSDFFGCVAEKVTDLSKYTFVWTHRGETLGTEQKLEIAEPENDGKYVCKIYDGEELIAKSYCYVYTNHEHEYIFTDALSATCTEGSKAVKECWMCDHKEEAVLSPALGHDYKEVAKVDATATTDGYVEYKCTRCEDTYKDVIKATGETTTVDQNNETTTVDQNNETTTVDQNNETTNAAVKPATVKKATVKAAKKSIKISFTKAKNAKKYIVQVAKNKKFKKLVKTVKNLKKTKTTIKKMKKGKYFVRIAGVNGKTKGTWSKAFKVTVK